MCPHEASSLACTSCACLVGNMCHLHRLLPLPCVVQLFFAKVPRSATSQQISDVFARFGEVESLNLFVPFEVSHAAGNCTACHAAQDRHTASGVLTAEHARF